MQVFDQIMAVCKRRGVVPEVGPFSQDFRLEDHADGHGPQITLWNTEKLGAAPTTAELESVTADEAASAVPRPRENREVMARRLTGPEARKMLQHALADETGAAALALFGMLTGEIVDVNGNEFRAGLDRMKPQVWPDPVVAASRIRTITE